MLNVNGIIYNYIMHGRCIERCHNAIDIHLTAVSATYVQIKTNALLQRNFLDSLPSCS